MFFESIAFCDEIVADDVYFASLTGMACYKSALRFECTSLRSIMLAQFHMALHVNGFGPNADRGASKSHAKCSP